jgi:hypothetical protein
MMIAKAASFFRASGSVVLGIEIKHEDLSPIVLQRVFLSIIALQEKRWSFFSF